jgi:hypothetical protein
LARREKRIANVRLSTNRSASVNRTDTLAITARQASIGASRRSCDVQIRKPGRHATISAAGRTVAGPKSRREVSATRGTSTLAKAALRARPAICCTPRSQ